MTRSGYVLLGLTVLLAVVSAAAAFAVLRFAAAARDSRRHLRGADGPSAMLSAAVQEAVTRLKDHAQATSVRADASERMSGRIVESLTAGLLVVDGSGVVQILNPAGRRMLGISTEPVGRAYPDVLVDAAPMVGVVEECLRSTQPIVRRSVALDVSGRVNHFGLTVSPVGGVGGPGGAICLFSDLTAIVDLEEQLRLKDTLAQLGELTAGIAHEFRNGLATIQGYSRLMEPQQLPPAYQPFLLAIRHETESLGRIVHNFLNFARPERVVFSEVSLNDLVADVVAESRTDQPTADIRVGGEFGRIEGDDVMLRQMLLNLIRNAVEACQDAGARPVVAVDGALAPAEGLCRIVVDDAGPGVAPSLRGRVFRPFFTTRAQGTGLGLAIVQKVVVTHNGRITIGSSPLGGARFELTLPLSQRAAA